MDAESIEAASPARPGQAARDEPGEPPSAIKPLAAAAAAAQALIACGGGGGGSDAAPSSSAADAEASRFLAQASMGAGRAQIERVKALGFAGWLDE